MYNGVKAMIKAEKELASPNQPQAVEGSVTCGAHLKATSDITGYPVFPDGTKSLIAKYLSEEVYNKYKG